MNRALVRTAAASRDAVRTDRNARLVRRFFDDVLARGREQDADELIAPDANVELPTGLFSGPAGVKRASAQIGTIFPDLEVEISDLIATGDRVIARWRLCGTERRERCGVPPSGAWTCLAGWSVTRVAGNRIVEHRMTEG